MKTVRGVTQAVISSPRARLASISICIALTALVRGILRSATLLDDFAIALAVLLLLEEIYFMHDWFVLAAQALLCPSDVICHLPMRQQLSALTIDDVPLLNDPTQLEKLLDVLKENNVKATLMIMSGFDLPESEGGMVPQERERCKSLLRRAVCEGHELGNHLQFDRPAIAMTQEEFRCAFNHCDALIAELSGKTEWKTRARRWFRPASALWNQNMLDCAREKGYTTATASCYPHDVASITRFVNSFYLRLRVRPGAIIVVHDRWHTPTTLAHALPRILSAGMKLGTLSDLQTAYDAEITEQKED
eukprot:TRINITY_DN17867_c0_g1_i1.p1 TRINITY_DN17867_c0_g1~~TRINITY_DN17867_c0_g1_i1.p1  ORF type:complete len:305 (-),score=31.70 TRINITY_DN17867_c0_g1_i1:36-950(-)